MPVSTRLVCAYCLESVEASVGDANRPPAFCPSCGSAIEPPAFGSDRTTEISSSREIRVDANGPTLAVFVGGKEATQSIGRFQLGDWIGGGGYGDVYRASDPRLEREVALKVLKPTKLDAKAIERFLREARAAAKLDHPNIVSLLDAGQDDGRTWIAYRLVRGRTLAQLRDSGAMGRREAATMVRDLALALHHAHRRGIFHRDLKPANVLVDEEGRPHLTDFGLARRADLDSELTGEGTVLGTPAYMSPEQAAGRANAADARSDIYSLGVVLYELICGRRPTDLPSNTPPWKLDRRTPPPAPESVDRAVPRALGQVCLKALHLNPDDRYPDAASFARALDGWLGLEAKSVGRRQFAVGLAGTILAAAIGVLGIAAGRSAPGKVEASSPPVADAGPGAGRGGGPTSTAALAPAASSKLPFVASKDKKAKKIHLRGCQDEGRIKDENRLYYATIEDAGKDGKVDPCKHCKPFERAGPAAP